MTSTNIFSDDDNGFSIFDLVGAYNGMPSGQMDDLLPCVECQKLSNSLFAATFREA